jgi:hypothetical protein
MPSIHKPFIALGAGLCCLLAACGGGSGSGSGGGSGSPSSLSAMVAEQEAANVLPVYLANDSLEGQDADSNGVRDDLDRFLTARGYSDPQLRAATGLAGALRNTLQLPDGDAAAARAAAVGVSLNLSCVYEQFSDQTGDKAARNVALLIEGASFNTRARLEKYQRFNTLLAGTTQNLDDNDACL